MILLNLFSVKIPKIIIISKKNSAIISVEAISTPPSQVSPREEIFPPGKEGEKQRKKLDKEMKQRAKEAERKKIKDEKRRLKEAEKEKKASNKLKSSNSVQAQVTLEDFRASAEDPIPLFLRKAITFIEREGLDAEGLYRVPGNRAHVELLFQVIICLVVFSRKKEKFNFLKDFHL